MERTPDHRARGSLTHKQLEQLVTQNLTVREIADAVDRSYTTVRYWLRYHGLETTREARTKRARGTEPQPRFEAECPKHGLTVFARRTTGATQCLRSAQKRFGLGSRGLARSLEALREEARKCVLLCSNCHAQVEAGVLALP